MNDSLQRFFVEIDGGTVGPEVLPPGERRLFLARPQIHCVPQRLDLFATEQSKSGGAWDRHVKGPTMRVHEVRYGARVAKCDKDTFGPRVELNVPGLRPVRIGEDLAAVVENTTNAPLHVRAAFLTRSDDTTYILGATAYTERMTRRLRVPPSLQGCIDVEWRADRACLIKRIWLHPERKDMSDLVIIDIKVNNRGQLCNSTGVPMEMFSDGLALKFDPVRFNDTVSFVVENLTTEERHFEVEIEAEVDDDEQLWMGEMPSNAVHMREYPLGFYAEWIAPGGAVHAVVSRPLIPFRGERLVIPSSMCPHFMIGGIRVGDRERLDLREPHPACHYSEKTRRAPLNLPTAPAGSNIVLKVINTSSEPQRFIAALLGTAGGTEPESTETIPSDVITDAMDVMRETPQFRAIVRQIARQKRQTTP